MRIHAPAAAVAERSTPTSGRIIPVDDTTCELVTGTDSLDELAVYLGHFGVPFTVLEPPELRDVLRAAADRLAAAATAPPADGR